MSIRPLPSDKHIHYSYRYTVLDYMYRVVFRVVLFERMLGRQTITCQAGRVGGNDTRRFVKTDATTHAL